MIRLALVLVPILVLPSIADAARCTGSASCRVCSDCSRCGHCRGSGSCGVCAGTSAGRSHQGGRGLSATPSSTNKSKDHFGLWCTGATVLFVGWWVWLHIVDHRRSKQRAAERKFVASRVVLPRPDPPSPIPQLPAPGVPQMCPECGRSLRRRVSRYGPFLGCSGYPACRWLFDLGSGRSQRRTRRTRRRPPPEVIPPSSASP